MSQGTLGLLKANGNDVWVLLITTGNVGTQDPDMSRFQLATIRRQEELAALADVGIGEDRYINLGYDDGLLEFENKKEVVAQLVRYIRKIRPDVLFAFDSGPTYRRWHKERPPGGVLPGSRRDPGRHVGASSSRDRSSTRG